ncbi:MAG: ribosomal L7Ae/L30e/S12e/Gadd45 family protein [Lachnospiraceae bacterium]|nr:ribosomal L7Ae/L30e/S12e/Gadd45 family protein [Lachnospiraceae bacterium]
MRRDKVLQMLGMAARAGAVKSGEFMTEASIKDGTACLVVLASDSSDNTKKQFISSCDYYNIPLKIYSDKISLGHCIGKEFRASVSVTDEGLANKILDLIKLDEQSLKADKKDEVL